MAGQYAERGNATNASVTASPLSRSLSIQDEISESSGPTSKIDKTWDWVPAFFGEQPQRAVVSAQFTFQLAGVTVNGMPNQLAQASAYCGAQFGNGQLFDDWDMNSVLQTTPWDRMHLAGFTSQAPFGQPFTFEVPGSFIYTASVTISVNNGVLLNSSQQLEEPITADVGQSKTTIDQFDLKVKPPQP